jgi:glycosyltransferase involved in cell wall biosynthesis
MWDSRPARTLLVWHFHGSWTASFVAGRHRYLIPVNGDEDTYGHGSAGRDWPRAQEVPSSQLRDEPVDLVVLQRPHELELAARWLGRRPGDDVPAVYVEHNAPGPFAVDSIHPFAGRDDIPLIHVTDYNCLMWNNGAAPTRVISHGIADPGLLYTGEIPAAAAMMNEPLCRWRTVGADLLDVLGSHAPIDVWGVDTEVLNDRSQTGQVRGKGDVPAPRLWHEVARHRVYLHTARWTSLSMSLVEAMYLGMPIVAVASTMAPLVVPPEAGVVSADIKTLAYALEGFVTDFPAATAAGKAARDFAMAHFALERFLAEWDDVIEECCG